MRRTILVAVLALAASTALADDKKKAKAFYDEGLQHYNLAEYTDAIKSWKESYRLSKKPLLLFNIGQAYRLSGDCKQAMVFYDSYQREEANPKNQDELDEALKLCKDAKPGDKPAGTPVGTTGTTSTKPGDKPVGAVGTTGTTATKPGDKPVGAVGTTTKPGDKPVGTVGATTTKPGDKPVGTTTGTATGTTGTSTGTPTTGTPTTGTPTTGTPDKQVGSLETQPDQEEQVDTVATTGGGLRKIGIGVGIAGAVMGGLGVYFALDSGKASNELDGYQGAWGPDEVDLEARGKRSATLGWVFGIGGVAALAAGGVMFAIGGPKAVETSSLSVIPTKGGAAFGFSTRF